MCKNLLILFLCSSCLAWGANSSDAQEFNEEARHPIGSRAPSKSQFVALQEERAKFAEEGIEEVSSTQKTFAGLQASAFGAAKLLQPAASYYYTSHPGALHYPISITVFGDNITLEDGSVWSVKGADAPVVLSWLSSDNLVLSPNGSFFSLYDYCLTNQNTAESVRVNLLLRPIYNSAFTHWVVAVDDYDDMVYLEDGSVWSISAFDGNVIRKWLVNDTVIIGINDGWLSSTRPNILINVETMTYAKANCIY